MVDNPGLTGSGDFIDLSLNCLDIGAGDDVTNIKKLTDRGVDVKYTPQNTSGSP